MFHYYEQGFYAAIAFYWNNAKRTLAIGERKGSYLGMLTERKFTLVLPDGGTKEVDYDGKPVIVHL